MLPVTASPSIALLDISFQWQDQLLFSQLQIEFQAGKFSVLLGPSGVGKSSLLRLIAGFEKSSFGQIELSDAMPMQGRIAYMTQEDGLLPWLSAIENVLIGPRLRQQLSSQDYARAKQLLAQVGLSDALGKRPASLSGGMRQRVALARTLMENAPIVLLDEPFSATDVVTRYELQNLAAELLADKTVIMVTHDPLEAVRLGHEIFLISGLPAELQLIMRRPEAIPRDRNDASVLQWQKQIWQKLIESCSA